jgi:uncharacterized protein
MTNRLSAEKSPYLLQHATNPVEWFPWGEEAFAKARTEDKPIFLSIGYATCHWCHVMAHESFEDENIAGLLNDNFVAIKVDREERPDVDRIYMGALQAMGISGGWPLSMFLTPELKPFYGGTYFPPVNRHERAGFPEILRRIDAIWRHKRADVVEAGERITSYLQELARAPGTQDLAIAAMVDHCFAQIGQSFDGENGGFGGAPKFPRPAALTFLARYHDAMPDAGADRMLLKTLRAIATGGIHDHVGGGFHRYAVDARWYVPHFEKMLYDQAQIAHALLDAAQLSGDNFFTDVAVDTLDYVLRDLLLPEGGFASAEDADSERHDLPGEHGEGAFYVWTRAEIMDLLGPDGPLFCFVYGVEGDGNVEHDPHQEFTGRNILYAARSLDDAAAFSGLMGDEVAARLASARFRLLQTRIRRPRPLRDDKVVAGWNGLMIGALARASVICRKAEYLNAARAAAEFVLSHMVDETTGNLFRSYREGQTKGKGQLQDVAFVVEGLLHLFEATGAPKWIETAIALSAVQQKLFSDSSRGGFFDTVAGDKSLLVRTREQYDGAEPTGNSTAAMNLWRLGMLTGNATYRTEAEGILRAFGAWMEKQPSIMPYLAAAVIGLTRASSQLVIIGKADDAAATALWSEVEQRYFPGMMKIRVNPDEQGELKRSIPYAGVVERKEGKATAYLCADFTCNLPVTTPDELRRLLDAQ